VRYKAIEKWDGQMPRVTGGMSMNGFVDVDKLIK
jgi:hypothetical protein